MAGSYSLSLAAMDIVSQALDLNTRVFPFEIPSFGQMQEDRIRIAKAVFNDLTQRGLIRHGEVVADVRRGLHALADSQVAITAMGTVAKGEKLFARASTDGETGVLAVQDGQKVKLELIRPTALPTAIVSLLPRMEPGPGQSVTLSKPAPVGARRDDDEANYFSHVHAPRGSAGSEQALRIARGYLSRPRLGAGFFAVIGRDRHGRDVRAGEVGWYDTDQGRYLSLSRPPGDDGQLHSTLSPADPARLVQRLTQLVESLAARR
jgi:hypothetical protein